MTREQYNQANDYVSQIEICEKVIKQIEERNVYKIQIGIIDIEDTTLIKGLKEYIKVWYTNRKTELETLLSEI